MTNVLLESKKLYENRDTWNATKAQLLDGLTGQRLNTTNLMLENAVNDSKHGLRFLIENASLGATGAGAVAMLPKIVLPIIRRVAPGVIANEIMGVQPMTGPLGYVYSLRFRYGSTFGAPNGVTAGTEALNPGDIAKFYSGNGNSTNPGASYTADMEGFGGRDMNLQLVSKAIEAKTRKLRASWTFEAQQDAQSQVGIDIEAEMMSVIAQEITAEIDQEMLNNLRNLAGSAEVTYDQASTSGTATFVGDEHAALATLITLQSNRIATRTRRGPGNWIVVSPTALTILQSGSTSALAKTIEGTFESPTNVKFVGTLNSSLKVYVDAYADASTGVLIGYKGSETDAGAFFCPYVPLMSTPVMMDPQTTQPIVSFMTRYAYAEMTNTADSLGNSADYFSMVGINSANLKFQ